uniref:RING-type domain-containing protein n=1 Tax=Bionectria ochroleuca TaxID=29856 RepID=A0A0B7K4E2_BIOOC
MFQKHVLLFKNPSWSGESTVPSTFISNVTGFSDDIAYGERIGTNLTTLTTTNARTLNGVIKGLLYVPDIKGITNCDHIQYDFIPTNVTRRRDLPPINYDLIALAPWFSMECTLAYLNAARLDPIRAFIFYKPNNSTNKPQDVDSPVWNLDDNGSWKSSNQFPVFAVPGFDGQRMMSQISQYSGNATEVPNSKAIHYTMKTNSQDYIRVATELQMTSPSDMLALWVFFIIVIGALLVIILIVSLSMRFIQRRRRTALQRRVMSGEVDLEASGIKRVVVPPAHVKNFPIFTYNAEPGLASAPPTPSSTGAPISSRSVRSSRTSRRHHDAKSVVSDVRPPGSIRSKRSSLAGSVDMTATNYQPNCHICLVRFEHRISIIRELPCGHIFHPMCIDEFLTENSSLCPMCKHCMLPIGYSPKITNAMVRRERALRRLRGRVDLEMDSPLEAKDPKIKIWGKRVFSNSFASTTSMVHEVPMTPIKPKPVSQEISLQSPSTPSERPESTVMSDSGSTAGHPEQPEPSPQPMNQARIARPRKKRPRNLRLLPTQPENSELRTEPGGGRKSPSSFARERMREIAAKNAPFDDPDQQRPRWRRAVSVIFPAFG